MAKLTIQQKHFMFWTLIFTALGAVLVFVSIVSRFHQMQQEHAVNHKSAAPSALHSNHKGM